ncbi:MAG: beta(1,3)galactosyltransferase EpsH [Bacilli bacterium]|nr:beta(1,3)galactosyltransferase EpsH [Bacilli bacterium]
MILVMLGTQNNSFERLLKELDRLKEKKIIKEDIIVQAGYTKYESKNLDMFDFIDSESLEDYQKKADLIITHGGVGSITNSIKKGKKVIAVPRLKKYEEHVNDHQKDIIESFSNNGYIIGIQDVKDLEEAYKKSKTFKPKKYIPNNSKILKIVENFIDMC